MTPGFIVLPLNNFEYAPITESSKTLLCSPIYTLLQTTAFLISQSLDILTLSHIILRLIELPFPTLVLFPNTVYSSITAPSPITQLSPMKTGGLMTAFFSITVPSPIQTPFLLDFPSK